MNHEKVINGEIMQRRLDRDWMVKDGTKRSDRG